MLWSVVAMVVLSSSPAVASEWEVDSSHSSVEFSIRHLVSNVRGRFDKVEGTLSRDDADPTQSKMTLTIDVASIDTGVPDRDKHLKSPDFFDAAKFPTMTFRSTKIGKSTGKDAYEVTGDLTLHGVTKPVTLQVQDLGSVKGPKGMVRGLEATGTLNRKDWGITWNNALDSGGTILGDEVKVLINLELKEKAQAAAPKK
ncbi:YceI family protein [Myxococcus stipitatus]|nr:YceI family protein [Myxococcus stipitatus]